MERLVIKVPEKKSKQVRSILEDMGVIIVTDTTALAKELDAMIPKDADISMDEIVEEVRKVRAGL